MFVTDLLFALVFVILAIDLSRYAYDLYNDKDTSLAVKRQIERAQDKQSQYYGIGDGLVYLEHLGNPYIYTKVSKFLPGMTELEFNRKQVVDFMVISIVILLVTAYVSVGMHLARRRYLNCIHQTMLLLTGVMLIVAGSKSLQFIEEIRSMKRVCTDATHQSKIENVRLQYMKFIDW